MTELSLGARLLRLISLMQDGSRWTAEELERATGVPGRTLRRDLSALKELGYRIISARGPGGHYRLERLPFELPLPLQDDEAVAAVVSLHAAAQGIVGIDFPDGAAARAEKRLLQSLSAAERRKANQAVAALEFSADRERPVDSSTFPLVYRAISEHRELSFNHHGHSGSLKRSVEPARLVSMNHRWYVHGWDRDRRDWRTFRLDRISEMEVTGNKFVPTPLSQGDVVESIKASFTGDGDERTYHLVTLELDADPATAASSLHRIDGALEPTCDGSRTRYSALVDSHEWLLTVLVLSDLDFTVIDPPEFQDAVARTAARFGRAT
ncbi:MAG TPA: WYL domain-containing protein [Candidatus Corynebacterium avicola]|uniref:WYL domain-containing protein n=1 Tax=Candidatus Corynebacterium avicola TaxID=2838527 RepID=A0A9D1RNC6_9CORY|nr:WYL domain-containing protein [Candidatus Corynebacterium avicola]